MLLSADVVVVTRVGSDWLLTAPPGAADLWLRARVVDADRDVVLLEAGDGSPLPAVGSRLIGAHGGADGIRRFDVEVKRHVTRPGSAAKAGERFVVGRPRGFVHVERRGGDRVPVRLPAELVVGVGDGEVETIRATTVDVSTGGVGVVASRPLRAGRRLLVLLHLDGEDGDAQPVLAGGVVAAQRSTARGGTVLGLELQVVDPRDQARILAHLSSRA